MSPATVTMLMNDVASLKAEQRKLSDRFDSLSLTLGKSVGDHQATVKEMFEEIRDLLSSLRCKKPRHVKARKRRCA